jgi:clan AA aspartic protease
VIEVGLAFADVEVNGVKFKALVDTGFNGDVLVSERVAQELKLAIIGESERKTVDNRVVKTKVSYGKLKVFDAEGYVLIEVVDEAPLDILIGVRALEALGFMVDPSTGTLKRVGLIAV